MTSSDSGLKQAVAVLLKFTDQPMTLRELRDRAGLPIPLFNLALDELDLQGRITWTNDDLVIRPPESSQQ